MKDQNLSNRIVAALGPFCCTKSRGEPSSGPDQSGGGAERELCAAWPRGLVADGFSKPPPAPRWLDGRRLSWTFAGLRRIARGTPFASTTTCRSVPGRPAAVGRARAGLLAPLRRHRGAVQGWPGSSRSRSCRPAGRGGSGGGEPTPRRTASPFDPASPPAAAGRPCRSCGASPAAAFGPVARTPGDAFLQLRSVLALCDHPGLALAPDYNHARDIHLDRLPRTWDGRRDGVHRCGWEGAAHAGGEDRRERDRSVRLSDQGKPPCCGRHFEFEGFDRSSRSGMARFALRLPACRALPPRRPRRQLASFAIAGRSQGSTDVLRPVA